ncbi:uncharacterized protein LOC121408905 isoform X2 [Lytechinus variegatus]|uniref:uncharacterized protein LOC121408905 isoform X2 n=1 Tax=Lytechinus variegatus TaxID=7654 RepID=UPI001BB21691|nr:uncharacterized protein LOC121408905 isoform X2 [Lytechinus variegatus]
MSSTPPTPSAEPSKSHPSYFFLATEVRHLIVERWTGDPIIDFIIVIIGAVFLSFIWQGLGRLSRVLHQKACYYAKLEAQLVMREKRQRRDRKHDRTPDGQSKRPAYLYHNGHVFHQSADYMELLDAHHERQRNLDSSLAAQVQRQQQRNASLLESNNSPSHLALEDGEEDVFLESNATQNTTVLSDLSGDVRTLTGDRGRSESRGSRHERNLSIDMDPNRWNSLQRNKKGYIGNHSRGGLKCYRFLYHCVQSVNHTLRFAMAYLLMLIVMTYNAWFLVATVGGYVLGYFLFSADLLTAAARTESAALTMRMRRRRLENVRPQTFYIH